MENKSFNSTELLLMFNASTSGKTFMYIENPDEKTTHLFMINPATLDAVKADKIKSIDFIMNPTPIPPRTEEQKAQAAAGHKAFSWRPKSLTETEIVELDRRAKTMTFRVTIAKGEKELKELGALV